MPDFDTVLHPDFLVPMVPKREVITGHSVAVKAGQIAAVLPRGKPRVLSGRSMSNCRTAH
jgi:5-methylthioadenosine/S-adenosylhomocysteine deaminase